MSADELATRADGTLELRGRLTFETVPALFARSPDWAVGAGAIKVDLAGVTLADSAGVALLVEWLHRARSAGRSLDFSGFPPQLRHLVRVSGLSEALGVS